jgi:uncharacterized phage protein (TIGR01671 family)
MGTGGVRRFWMREILFRGKRKDNGEWVYGDLCHDIPGARMILVREGIYEGEDFLIHPETLGQYTGIEDKNGAKIFEGDIIKGYYFLKDEYYVGKVEYSEELSAYILTGHGYNQVVWLASFGKPDTEIIGNVIDNPELLDRE